MCLGWAVAEEHTNGKYQPTIWDLLLHRRALGLTWQPPKPIMMLRVMSHAHVESGVYVGFWQWLLLACNISSSWRCTLTGQVHGFYSLFAPNRVARVDEPSGALNGGSAWQQPTGLRGPGSVELFDSPWQQDPAVLRST